MIIIEIFKRENNGDLVIYNDKNIPVWFSSKGLRIYELSKDCFMTKDYKLNSMNERYQAFIDYNKNFALYDTSKDIIYWKKEFKEWPYYFGFQSGLVIYEKNNLSPIWSPLKICNLEGEYLRL